MRGRALTSRLALLAILVVASALRLWGASGRALWFDEAFCVRLAQFDWSEIAARAALDNHPPLFFAILKVWVAVFGSSPLAMRGLEVLLGVATVGLVYALARRVFRTTVTAGSPVLAATIAAGWVAVHPVHVLWTTQVRMYALAGLLATASALLLLRALENPTASRRWVAWTLTAIALAYTHYFGAFVVLAQGLFAVVTVWRSTERRAGLVRVVVSGLAIGLAFAPWLSVVVAQSGRIPGRWWVPHLSPARLLWTWSRTAGLLIDDEAGTPPLAWGIVSGALGLALAVICGGVAVQRDRGLRMLAWCTLLPVVAAAAVSVLLGENVVLSRYLIVALVVLPIVVVGGLYRWLGERHALLAMVPIAAVVVTTLVGRLPTLEPQPDVPAAAAWIAEHERPGDLVLVHQFYYWSFRTLDSHVDPQLRLFANEGVAVQTLGAPLVTADDIVVGPRDLPKLKHQRWIVVDSSALPARVGGFPPSAFEEFATWMPPSDAWAIRVRVFDW